MFDGFNMWIIPVHKGSHWAMMVIIIYQTLTIIILIVIKIGSRFSREGNTLF